MSNNTNNTNNDSSKIINLNEVTTHKSLDEAEKLDRPESVEEANAVEDTVVDDTVVDDTVVEGTAVEDIVS